MKAMRLLGSGAAAAGAGILAYGAWSAVAWARYGHPRPERHPHDELLDRFIPDPEVDEYHQFEVISPAAITFAVAKGMDLQASPVIKGIFWLRAVPALLRGQPSRRQGSRGTAGGDAGAWLRRPGRDPRPGNRGRHLHPALAPAGDLPPPAAGAVRGLR
jgi:hypothetical protein